MHGGPHYSTVALVSNHQASNFNYSNARSQYFWWVFRILGFEGGIGPPMHGGTHYSTEARFQITKHLNLDILVLECYLFRSLKYKRT
jgi:hypothetical protein